MWLKGCSVWLNVVFFSTAFPSLCHSGWIMFLNCKIAHSSCCLKQSLPLSSLFFPHSLVQKWVDGVNLQFYCTVEVEQRIFLLQQFHPPFMIFVSSCFARPLFLVSSIFCHHYLMCSCYMSWFTDEAQTWVSSVHMQACALMKLISYSEVELSVIHWKICTWQEIKD